MLITQRVSTLGIACLFGFVLSGCSLFAPEDAPDPEPTPPRTLLAPTSPENVINNLIVAYEEKNIDYYRDVMHPEYVFVPSPGDPDVTFTELPFAEDQASTENMFNLVETIELTLTHTAPRPSDRAEYPATTGHRLIQVQAVNLRVVTREGSAGDPLIYLVGGDPAQFIFRPDSTQSPVTWKIVYQQDDS